MSHLTNSQIFLTQSNDIYCVELAQKIASNRAMGLPTAGLEDQLQEEISRFKHLNSRNIQAIQKQKQ